MNDDENYIHKYYSSCQRKMKMNLQDQNMIKLNEEFFPEKYYFGFLIK